MFQNSGMEIIKIATACFERIIADICFLCGGVQKRTALCLNSSDINRQMRSFLGRIVLRGQNEKVVVDGYQNVLPCPSIDMGWTMALVAEEFSYKKKSWPNPN